MQLEIKQPSLPEVTIANFDELKQELQNKMDHYRGRVYTDDQIKDAKKDLAALRKFSTAMSDERIRVKKEWLKPVEAFEDKIKELTAIVHEPIILISKQVNEFEEQKKAAKKQQIEAYWMEVLQADKVPAGVDFSHVFDEKWLNASVSMKSIQEAIDAKLVKFAEELAVIRELPAYAFEAEEYYKNTFNLAESISIAHRMTEQAERKAAYEAEKAKRQAAEVKPEPVAEKPVESLKQWLSFKALLTVEDAKALKAFFQSRNIEFEKI